MDISDIEQSAISVIDKVSPTEWVIYTKLRDHAGYEVVVNVIITERMITYLCSLKDHPKRDRAFLRHYLRSCGITFGDDHVAYQKYRMKHAEIAKKNLWTFISAIHVAWNI